MGDLAHQAQKTIATSMAAACLIFLASSPAWAADFAGKDISGVDYSGQDLSGKDFTGVIAKNTNFHNCNLQDSKFSKANLVKADLSGADVRGANFVGATLDESNFKDVQGQKAIFSNTILDIGVLENIDLTSAIWPSKLRIMICDMDELKGTNPVTGVESRDTLFLYGLHAVQLERLDVVCKDRFLACQCCPWNTRGVLCAVNSLDYD
eukprot:CAMPEP_0198149672 /NCGR_PEP_ID=MMETSP1443-20131203/47717_1 /TAXON_ID=186043 /ORGANISM="Entomoneis sp., Strain CCMP2396" /LENGTH=207 /DNA_ID=CAMNT_0043814779 /DNA_START=181 /DNA_END=803 /DNA_ORIENTATION=+